MRTVIDIETNGFLNTGLDYSQLPFKLKPSYKLWCIVLRDIDTLKTTSLVLQDCTKERLKQELQGCTELVGHNIVGFDLPVLYLLGLLEYTISYPDSCCTIFGTEVEITDTLIWSKLLNPDRLGGHSLAEWGKRLGNYKEHFTDFRQYTPEMLHYCEQDTSVNVSVYFRLKSETKEHNWKPAYQMERKLVDITLKQEIFGFDFDVELAQKNINELDTLMKERAIRVDPVLPPKALTQLKLMEFTPPKIQFKKDGTFSTIIQKFAEKHSATLNLEDRTFTYQGKVLKLPLTEPIVTTEPASIDNIDVVKGYLLSLGWIPSEIKERDLVKNTDKTLKTAEEIDDAIERYLKQTEKSLFKELRLNHMQCKDMKQLKTLLYSKVDGTKPIYVPTTPKLQVGVEKTICPNLEILGEKAEFVKDVCEYFTYRHRRNAIAGGEVDEDGEPITGFLSAIREDGRIPTPADTLGANTGRYRHKIVCNIPRVTSLYGEQMRNLFGAGKDFYQLGFDFASLEARVQGHYCLPYTEGKELAEALIAEKPNDIHCFRQDTEILTLSGWKTFGEIGKEDKVAQYTDGNFIEFVTPESLVWEKYKGIMHTDPTTNFSVTPNHRVYYESYSAIRKGLKYARICEAKDFKASSDKRYVLGGITTQPEYKGLTDSEIKLLVATQADGHLSKDCSAICFSFVKKRKIERMKKLLEEIGCSYKLNSFHRKGRDEVNFRISSGKFCLKIRSYLNEDKTPRNCLLGLSARQLNILIDEVVHWDGCLKKNSDVVLDTTSKATVDFVQSVCSLIGRKCKISAYLKNTNFGDCKIYRAYIGKTTTTNTLSANKELVEENYEGYIGCVSVPSGLILVRRKGSVIVSGNSVNARKLGIDRSSAKSFSYAAMYGAQPKKLAKMLGISETESKILFEEYWNAVIALKELKEKLEQHWESNGKKWVQGLDGRKIMSRSKHSLINVLFQSGGALVAKWSTVLMCKYLEERNLLGDPFLHSVKDLKVYMMIAMHDEAQLAVHPKLLKVRAFATEEEAKANLVEGCSAIGHGSKGYYIGYRTLPVEAIDEGIKAACKRLKVRVPMGFEWIPGKSWGQCH